MHNVINIYKVSYLNTFVSRSDDYKLAQAFIYFLSNDKILPMNTLIFDCTLTDYVITSTTGNKSNR